jgi:hypothetical protein
VLQAKVHSANVSDQEGIKALLLRADRLFPRLSHLWVEAGYRAEDKGADWVRKTLGWSVDLVERPKKPAPGKVLMAWAKEWAKAGVAVDRQKLLPSKAISPRSTVSWDPVVEHIWSFQTVSGREILRPSQRSLICGIHPVCTRCYAGPIVKPDAPHPPPRNGVTAFLLPAPGWSRTVPNFVLTAF